MNSFEAAHQHPGCFFYGICLEFCPEIGIRIHLNRISEKHIPLQCINTSWVHNSNSGGIMRAYTAGTVITTFNAPKIPDP